jgi:hypothetical protein
MASPHFSPGGVIMAPDFLLQRVLASEERSRNYGQGSMCALKGKRQARGAPSTARNRKPSKQDKQAAKENCLS